MMHRYARTLGLLSVGYAASMYACSSQPPGGRPTSSEGSEPIEVACAEFADAAGWHPGEAVATAAAASSERVVAVGDKMWPLALDLLEAVPASELGNLAQSPTSFYAAMGMAYARWQTGQCGERIATVLRFPETGDAIHDAIGAGLRTLGQRVLPPDGEQPGVVLNLSPSRWTFGVATVPDEGDIERIYGATPHAVLDHGEASRALINCVIEQQSSGLLKDFIPKRVIGNDTLALDINVTYLKAPWPKAFREDQVDFKSENGETKAVEGLYSRSLTTAYYEASTFNAIHLPLSGDHLRVLVVVPNDIFTGSIATFVESLSDDDLKKARDTTTTEAFEFRMPQVNIASSSLNYVERLGFDCEEFTLGDLIHGAAVVMDEGGIEAVAATVAEEWGDGAPEPSPRVFAVDRPFLFFVYDAETRFVLFSGRVLEAG